MDVLYGISASAGLSEGRSVAYFEPDLDIKSRPVKDIGEEEARLLGALNASISELVEIKERMRSGAGDEFAHIFRSQQTIVEDETLVGEIRETILSQEVSAEQAVKLVFESYIALFDELGDDDYNKARVADLSDVYRRVLKQLLGVESRDLTRLPAGSIVVSEDLLPSDTAMMDRTCVAGFVTSRGGMTSHVAILAKSLGIPAVVGVERALERIPDGSRVFIDSRSSSGAEVYVEPDKETVSRLHDEKSRYDNYVKELEQEKELEPLTQDGRSVVVSGNLGSDSELGEAVQHGLSSIGLFRTEFLFLKSSSLPSEDKQFNAYRSVAKGVAPGMVIFRTLDVGGDKPITYMNLPEEKNPFLGVRAIRISLKDVESFKVQLRAILRSSVHGNVKVMFPMVSGLNEVRRLKEIVTAVEEELRAEEVHYDDRMEVGIMVEIPSAVLMADDLAKEVDFMSIGTNDLTQYLLAADRMNENVRDYYEPFHPAVFRSIKQVTNAMHGEDKWVGVCGELGGMAEVIPVLVGLGVDELSMTPQLIPEAIHTIRGTMFKDAVGLAEQVLEQNDAADIRRLLTEYWQRLQSSKQTQQWRR